MKTNSKLAILFAGIAMASTALVGCGSAAEVDTGHTITVWTTFNDTYGAIIQKAINSFQSKYPEYKVKYTKFNGGYNDLASAVVKGVSAGDYPDMCAVYPDSVANFILTGKALNIDPYMRDPEIGWTDNDFQDIPETYIEEGQKYMIEGTYSLPICKSTEAMFYNRDKLIGLDLSNIDDEINDGQALDDEYIQSLTWDELFDHLCPAIMAYDVSVGGTFLTPSEDYKDTWALVGYDSDDNLFITLAEQYGLGYTSVNKQTGAGHLDFVETDASGKFTGVSEGYMNLMKKFAVAFQNKYFTTKGVIGKNVNYVSTTGGMLFSIGSTGGVKYQFSDANPFDVGVARIPQVTDVEADTKLINQGPSIAFMKRGADKNIIETRAKGEWLFYKEWTSAAINCEWAINTGYAPIRESVKAMPDYLNYVSIQDKPTKTLDRLTALNAKYSGDTIDYLFSSPVFSGSAKARTSVSGIFADIFKKTISTTDATPCPINPLDPDYDTKMAKFESTVKTYFSQAYNNAL